MHNFYADRPRYHYQYVGKFSNKAAIENISQVVTYDNSVPDITLYKFCGCKAPTRKHRNQPLLFDVLWKKEPTLDDKELAYILNRFEKYRQSSDFYTDIVKEDFSRMCRHTAIKTYGDLRGFIVKHNPSTRTLRLCTPS
jgi:hypothetical protein